MNDVIIYTRYSFCSNKLWEGMSDIIIGEWIERWKDRKRMTEENWYIKYNLCNFYFRYICLIEHLQKISSLRNVKSKFVLWYFEHFISNYS